MVRKAVFLDRDGTLNVDKGYIWNFDDFEILPGVIDSLKLIQDKGYSLIIITNQAGIAKGLYSIEDFNRFMESFQRFFEEQGIIFDGVFMCPHHPSEGNSNLTKACNCRKPRPGLILRAAELLDIDLSESWMIGDKPSDVEAGINAGCKSLLLRSKFSEGYKQKMFEGLPDAVDFLLNQNN